MIGGGTVPHPGEISLAHRGVLFLDEFTEFDPQVIESLRQPMEDKTVTISRATTSSIFPCNFQLIAAMNPCPCGFFGDQDRNCSCSEYDRARYKRKISGPILDRIDLYLYIPRVKYNLLSSNEEAENSSVIRERVQFARDIQTARFNISFKDEDTLCNADISQKALRRFIDVDVNGRELLSRAVKTISMSARGYFKLLKVAKTIADLESAKIITEKHISEALSFRMEFQR